METIIIIIAVVIAVWFLYRRIARTVKGDSPSCGCGGGGDGCPSAPQKEIKKMGTK